MQGGDHAILEFQEPLLHLASGFGRGNDIQQLHDFTLTALHVGDVQHISEHHTSDAFKALLQMGLHSAGESGKEIESLHYCLTSTNTIFDLMSEVCLTLALHAVL